MAAYIKPPSSRSCVWRKGAPPSIGWWPASAVRDPRRLRWWDGKHWSILALDNENAEEAAEAAAVTWGEADLHGIRWCDPWWPTHQQRQDGGSAATPG